VNQSPEFDEAVSRLRGVKGLLSTEDELKNIVESKGEVLRRFQPIFMRDHLLQLTEQEFSPLLYFENNHHWSGLHRHLPKIRANMPLLRKVLAELLEESKSIEERFNYAVETVPGMGKAIVTAILQIVFPREYGVWNNTSEGGLKALNIWPQFDRGESMGGRYIKINDTLKDMSRVLEIDLWTLDSLWWAVKTQSESIDSPEDCFSGPISAKGFYSFLGFGLERQLHEFMTDNWEKISLGQEWIIYSDESGDDVGVEYPCGRIGSIDILARHKNGKDWLVVELKRNQTNDDTVGQVLRYMGWVKAKKAEPDEKVKGLIIAREANQKLLYALNATKDVDLQLYEVEFRLHQAPILEGGGLMDAASGTIKKWKRYPKYKILVLSCWGKCQMIGILNE